MNIADLERLLPKQEWPRTFYRGRTMTSLGSRDEEMIRKFPSEDAMVRWVIVNNLKDESPRPGAVLHESMIAPTRTRARWRVSVPDRSELLAHGDGLLVVKDASGLHADPEHGATQITILDAATGAVRATWLPPHGVTRAGFLAGELAVSNAEQATVVDPLTGTALRSTEPLGWEFRVNPTIKNTLKSS